LTTQDDGQQFRGGQAKRRAKLHQPVDKRAGFGQTDLETDKGGQKIQELQIKKSFNVNHRASVRD